MDFFQIIRQIGIFMICAQTILHFKPSAQYEKYLKLLISVMVLLQILFPVLRLVSSGGSEQFLEEMQQVGREMSRQMEQLEIEKNIEEDAVVSRTKLEIKTRLNKIAYLQGMEVVKVRLDTEAASQRLQCYVREKEHFLQEAAGDTIQAIRLPEILVEIPVIPEEVQEQPEESAWEKAEESARELSDGKAWGNFLEEPSERIDKLQVLCKAFSEELGIMEKKIEVLWYE